LEITLRNHADGNELLNDTVEYERLNMSRSVRIRQIAIYKKSSSQKPNISRQNNITSSKQEDVKITVEHEVGLTLHS